jgi:hypothetical protein
MPLWLSCLIFFIVTVAVYILNPQTRDIIFSPCVAAIIVTVWLYVRGLWSRD